MIRHLFKLIWNQKRKNLGLSFELFFSFLVLFGVFSFSIFYLQRYMKPLGFEYKKVWTINMSWNQTPDSLAIEIQGLIRQKLSTYPEIQEFTFSTGNIPFTGYGIINEINYEEVESGGNMFTVDNNYQRTMGIQLLEGRWFKQEEQASEPTPVVLTEELREKLFEGVSPIGKVINYDKESKGKVVGVATQYRYRGDLEYQRPGLFIQDNKNRPLNRLMMKMDSEADANFEAKLLRDLQNLASDWSFEIDYLSDLRKDMMSVRLIPIIFLSILSGFLIFNVALGLFGVLWQNINKRKDEIGIRRAMGSTKPEITFQFIGETLILATFSIALGFFFAVQFPLLNIFQINADIYLWGILAASLFIYLLVFLCAFFPSSQAAKLHPAVALREE